MSTGCAPGTLPGRIRSHGAALRLGVRPSEAQDEPSPTIRTGFYVDRAPMALHDTTHDGQAEAVPDAPLGWGSTPTSQWSENALAFVGSDSWSRVVNEHLGAC